MIWFKARHRRRGYRQLTAIGERSVMWVDRDHASSVKVLCANPPDYGAMTAWKRAIQPGDLFVDVGANVGSYTLWMAEQGAEVLALEPDPEACACLRENVALNGYPVRVLQLALSAGAKVLRFTSGLDSENHVACAGDNTGHLVRASTLDALIGQRTVAGVKVDVEGAELFVLQGAGRALAEHRIRLLQLEWNECSLSLTGSDRTPTAKLLESFGYALFRPDQDGRLRPIETYEFGADVFAKPMTTRSSRRAHSRDVARDVVRSGSQPRSRL